MKITSDGSTAIYYELPDYATELQHLISHKNMNGQVAEIFRACYRYGEVSHSDMLRDARKIRFYAEAEIARLLKLAEPLPETRVQPWTAPDCDDAESSYRQTVSCSHDWSRNVKTRTKTCIKCGCSVIALTDEQYMPDYCDSETYAVSGDLLHDDTWRDAKAPDFGPCDHLEWHYYHSTHSKKCQNPNCGHEEAWNGET